VLASAVEHPAVRESARAAGQVGIDTRELPVDDAGVIDRDALDRTLSSRCTLVAVMTANNETGVIQPLDDVVASVRRRAPGAVVFTDAVQAAPYLDLADVTAGVDMVGLSAHKFGGPVGTGALAVSPRVNLSPRLYGGGQERERRSGTPDVAGAVGMATALQLVSKDRVAASLHVSKLRNRLADGLLAALPWAHRTVPAGVPVLPGHLHLCLPRVDREELLVALSGEGICVSGGSSCASGALEPSHVLAAMGVDRDLAVGAVRFSLGHDTTDEDVDRALAVVPRVAAALHRPV
jgi:cysteine desulfurase